MDWTKTVVAVACVCAFAAHGMPSQAELKQAQVIVTEVMRSDVVAFNAGKKKPTEVANAAIRYAGEAQGEAARFLLLKGAFFYRMRAGDYDGAMAVISQMRSDIADVPDKTIVDILSGALRRVPRKHCGQLYDLLQRTQNRIRYTKEVEALAAKAKANPSDKAVRTALGEMRALLGDWGSALPELAAGEGPAAKAAALEQDAKTGEAADAWWALAGTDGSDRSLAYRAHAVRLYRAAVRDGSLPGLKKTIAEKRIAEAKADGLPDEPEDTPTVAAPVSQGERPKPLVLDLGGGVKMEMAGCPADTFMMGFSSDKEVFRPHKVTLTRPFWMGKFPVTVEQWEKLMRPIPLPSDSLIVNAKAVLEALGGKKLPQTACRPTEVDEFMSFLNKRFTHLLPRGYVFRLPTWAEWEYACRANGDPARDWFAMPIVKDLKDEDKRRIVVSIDDRLDVLRKNGVAFNEKQIKDSGRRLPFKIGTKMSNTWGFSDMLGNANELLMDTFSPNVPFPKWGTAGIPAAFLNWTDKDIDPLFWDSSTNAARSLIFSHPSIGWGTNRLVCRQDRRDYSVGFRVCVGPDLLKERGIKPPSVK